MLGRGQFGDVFKDGNIAVKKFKEVDAMIQELIATKYFMDSPYIIKCTEFDFVKLEMRLDLYDMSLKKAVNIYDFTMEERRIIFKDILAGVCHLHSRYIHHCDLKYSNILVNISPLRAVVADLGLASMGKYARFYQTPMGYRRPKSELGSHHEHRHDLYSLAVLGVQLFGGIELEEVVVPDRLKEIIRELEEDIPSDIGDTLLDFVEDIGKLYPTARSAYKGLYGEDIALAIPATSHPSPQRISDENRSYIYDTMRERTKKTMKMGKRGYNILMERLNNPKYEKVPQTEYPLYMACMILIIWVMFENDRDDIPNVMEMTLGRWSTVDIARVYTDLITKDELINIILSPD